MRTLALIISMCLVTGCPVEMTPPPVDGRCSGPAIVDFEAQVEVPFGATHTVKIEGPRTSLPILVGTLRFHVFNRGSLTEQREVFATRGGGGGGEATGGGSTGGGTATGGGSTGGGTATGGGAATGGGGGGDVDAGEVDAGEVDAGAPDAGLPLRRSRRRFVQNLSARGNFFANKDCTAATIPATVVNGSRMGCTGGVGIEPSFNNPQNNVTVELATCANF